MSTLDAEILNKMEAYAGQWQKNADAFSASGDYAWMSSFVSGYRKVLEIGTGVGHSTLVLLRDGHEVLGVDLNPWCVSATARMLREKGFVVDHQARDHQVIVEDDGWGVRYGKIPSLDQKSDATLLLSDVLTDDELPPLLEASAPFDAICWWCPGAYGYRAGPTDQDKKRYRFEMRQALCHAANRLLRVGGRFHVVERSVAMEPGEHRASLTESYTAAASGTLLKMTKIDFRPIESLAVEGGIAMPHAHLSGDGTGSLVLISIIMTKES